MTEGPGWLRLRAGIPLSPGDQTGPQSNQWTNELGLETVFWRAYNTIGHRIMGATSGAATAQFDISNMVAGQKAGFVRYGGVYHLLGVKVDDFGKRNLFFMDKIGEEMQGPEMSVDHLFVRTTNKYNQAIYEYSTDGIIFKSFGPEFTIAFGNWTGDRLGFFCWNEKEEDGFIDIDWFQYDYDGPKSTK